MASDEKLLTEIRENFDYAVDSWRDIREQARLDMRCVAGNPWPDEERKARKDAGRLCLTFDELQQYCNRAINDIRQNKRAAKVTPIGNGANDQTAEIREGLLRQIEYQSKGQVAKITAYEAMIQRSYGYFGLTTKYEKSGSDLMKLGFRNFPNPNVVYPDPDFKEPDGADMGWCFVLDSMKQSKFTSRWKNAEIQSFSSQHAGVAPAWIKDGRVQVAEYWKVHSNPRTLLRFENGEKQYLDQIRGAKLKKDFCIFPDGSDKRVEMQREDEDKTVCQYITNGLEILEKKPWPDIEIPIFPVLGKEMYVDEGTGDKRVLLSLVRFAREPFLAYCYARTSEVEVAGDAPKTTWMGYEGQFNTSTPWDIINRIKLPFAEVKAKTTATGDTLLPLPQRQEYNPPIQSLEVLAESCRRAIQSAMGITGLLGGASDKVSARSGTALKELDAQTDTGNFHFVDNYDRAVERCGRAEDRLLKAIYDTPREMGFRKPNDEHTTVKVNQPGTHPISGDAMEFNTADGDHDVTISTGPSFDSQRDEVDSFIETLVKLPNVPPKVVALAVKLKQLGPLGDEIAAAFAPPEDQQQIPPQVQQQLQTSQQMIEQQTAEIHDLAAKLESKRDELDVRLRIAEMQEETKRAALASNEDIVRLQEELQVIHNQLDRQHQLSVASAAPPEPASPAAPGPPAESGDGGSAQPQQV